MKLPMALLAAIPMTVSAQTFDLPEAIRSDSAATDRAIRSIAQTARTLYAGTDRDDSLNTVFRLELLSGDYVAGLRSLTALRELRGVRDPVYSRNEYTQYELYARARQAPVGAWRTVVRRVFLDIDRGQSDLVAYRVAGSFTFDVAGAEAQWARALSAIPEAIPLNDAVALARQYFVLSVFRALVPVMPTILSEAETRRYAITAHARVPLRDGGSLTVTVVRPRSLRGKQPAVLEYTIYAGAQNRLSALEAASQGFVGVVATSRGKRLSTGPVRPWETEARDARDLLDWIARQPWSNGAVGMLGGSYAGFTQWAAAGTLHPALKTIVPAAAVAPGIDTPRENGIMLTFQYRWAHWVGSNGLLEDALYGDGKRWSRLDSTWFARGSAYRDLDVIDGTPNPIFRRWLEHPAFDAYWQRMMPSAAAYAKIAIPVLSITGYFDGAQPGALHYFRAHLAARPAANHTLLMGPWDHFGAQRRPSPVLGDLRIDPVANVDVTGLIYDWMRHVLRGAPRPALLSDRVNYQPIGTNTWQHAASLAAMSTDTMVLHPSRERVEADHRLEPTAGSGTAAELTVDLRDRRLTSSAFISLGDDRTLDRDNGVAFVSEPLREATLISGSFTADLVASINARDVDLGVLLYERTAQGVHRQLSYWLGRASLARDYAQRQLLRPGVPDTLPLRGARVVSRVLPAGSRLVVVVNINKNAESQLNYGTGQDVSDETVRDATEPLRLTVFEGSTIRVPVRRPPN